jgi:hypothetical protein
MTLLACRYAAHCSEQSTVAKALLPVLLKEEEHVAPKATIYRVRENDVRATCGECIPTIWDSA